MDSKGRVGAVNGMVEAASPPSIEYRLNQIMELVARSTHRVQAANSKLYSDIGDLPVIPHGDGGLDRLVFELLQRARLLDETVDILTHRLGD